MIETASNVLHAGIETALQLIIKICRLVDLATFVTAVLTGIISSLAVVIFYEWAKKPRLSLEIGTVHVIPQLLTHTPTHRFLHVKAVNHRSRFWGRLMPRNAALFCRAWVDVFPGAGAPFTFDARWTTKREPGEYIGLDKLKIDPGLVYQIPREDIHAGEEAEISIAVKHQNEEECYGFNNKSYMFSAWKNPDWKIGLGKHRVAVRLSCGDLYITRNFFLNNQSNRIDDFKLEPL
jgi:hypothetical protein